MSEDVNPAADAWEAIKSRLAGPTGTFILVWCTCHPKILSFVFFDSAGNTGAPQAQAKIDAISNLTKGLSAWTLFWRPLLWSVLVLLLMQIVSTIWHAISDEFRYYRERITYRNDVRADLYRRFSKNPDELISTMKHEMNVAHNYLLDFPAIPHHHRGIMDELEKRNAIIKQMLEKTSILKRHIDVVRTLLIENKPNTLLDVIKAKLK
jgi:DNA-binding helix-hairpin-helix protein with protein kinase domain